ncbi:PB1 [Aedes alboannulatus orthomyxo-like virus]|nr:PB1 [Aedes alboannulatus orthomyxo-like virus]
MNGEADLFDEVPNSFYSAVFNRGDRGDLNLPKHETLNTLSTVSGLYLYTNPPPHGTGTPAPKVAESVLRSMEFNLKTEDRTATIDGYVVDNPVWTESTDFPYHETTSNFEPGALHEMSKCFLKDNYEHISTTAERVINKLCMTNSDELTKGRQTWDPEEEKSVPCGQAYSQMCDLITNAGLPNHHTVVELIQHYFTMMSMEELDTKEVKYSYNQRRRNVAGQMLVTRKRVKKVVKVKKQGEEVYRHLMDAGRSFCSYLKHGERAHLDRRAIASTGIPLRALFLVAEEFHLDLGKLIKGSTISIGGELKKVKISTLTSECKGDSTAMLGFQATQDATKWNECLSAMGFGMLTKTLFNKEVRTELCLPRPSPSEQLLEAICMASHWMLAVKMITLGSGLQGGTEYFHGEIPFVAENLPKFNVKTQEWFRQTIPFLYGNNYMLARGGMLMGMHNALSTTYGLVNVGFKKPPLGNIYTLRSSDDSMTIFTGPDMDTLRALISGERVNLKMCGINLSDKKTFIFPIGYGEYTSWYQDGALVAQYGAEATRIKPTGMNPPDDFYGVVKSTANGLMNLESNNLGAEAKIRLGIANVRSLYRIKRRQEDENGISLKVRVLADGGLNPWNCSNCHLEETSLKERFAGNQLEIDYFMKIRMPDNPFTGTPSEEITWSRETGCLTVDRIDSPRTVFHYLKRANATINNTKGPTHADKEKNNARALEIMTLADPTTLLRVPGNAHTMVSHVISCMETSAAGVEFDPSEKILIEAALNVLRSGRVAVDVDEEAIDMDDDL